MTNLYDPRFEYNTQRSGGGWSPKDQDAVDASVNEYMQSDEFKRKVASKQEASVNGITRLEDLAPVQIELMVALSQRPSGTIIFKTHQDYLQSVDLITVDLYLTSRITERGRALVADYQQRQVGDERQPAGADDDLTRAELMQKVSEESHRNKSATIDRLQAEKQALEAEVKQYRELLNAALLFAPKEEPQLWRSNENHMYADSLYTLGLAVRKVLDASK